MLSSFHRDHAGLVGNVVFKLGTEMLDHGAHRHGRSVAQGADGAALNVVRHRVQHVEVAGAALAVLDAIKPDWEADLARRTGRTVRRKPDAALSLIGGYAQAIPQ
jgi:hypothetical protein